MRGPSRRYSHPEIVPRVQEHSLVVHREAGRRGVRVHQRGGGDPEVLGNG